MPSSEPQATSPPPQPKVVRWWRDYPLLILFAAVWVAPMFWMGATKTRLSYKVAAKIQKHVNLRQPVLPVKFQEYLLPKDPRLNRVRPITWYDVVCLPREITHLHNASCLFTKTVTRWSTNHVQGTVDGMRWVTLKDELYSPMKPFGHRARIDRFLSDIGAWKRRSSVYRHQADEMCDWYRTQNAKLNPLAPPLVAVRLVGLSYSVGDPFIAEPAGRWIKRIPEDVDDRKPYVIHTKRYPRGKPATAVQTPRTEDVARAYDSSRSAKGEPCCDGL